MTRSLLHLASVLRCAQLQSFTSPIHSLQGPRNTEGALSSTQVAINLTNRTFLTTTKVNGKSVSPTSDQGFNLVVATLREKNVSRPA